MSYEYTCKYCDYKWITDYKISRPKCSRCNDKNFKVKEIDNERNGNGFGYEPEKENDDSSDWFSQAIKWGSD